MYMAGRNKPTMTTPSSTPSYHLLRTSMKFWVIELKHNMAISETTKIITPCQTLSTPISRSWGLKMKTTGSSAVRIS